MKSPILVSGGAGYIGSHFCKLLDKSENFYPVVIDNLCNGHKESVRWDPFEFGDVRDTEFIVKVIRKYDIQTAIIHFAAHLDVEESVRNPQKYNDNNVSGTLSLLEAAKETGIENFIFSSTAAVYGNPTERTINENHPLNPINPYGMSKLLCEKWIEYYSRINNIKFMILRYFNASGADPELEIGPISNHFTHLIPIVLDAALGRRNKIQIYGSDYDTEDGTCVRDYIHVNDLAKYHILAVNNLINKCCSSIWNLGTGQGHSVLQIINKVKNITGKDFDIEYSGRRAGDPAILVADPRLVHGYLKPEYGIDEIIEHTWNWHRKRFAK